MTIESSFIENNISKPLVTGMIFAAGSYIPACVFSVNPLVAAVFAATFVIVSEITHRALTYSLNSFGLDKNIHKFTYFLAGYLEPLSGIFAAYYTTLKVIGTVTLGSYPISFILSSCLIAGGLCHLLKDKLNLVETPNSTNLPPVAGNT